MQVSKILKFARNISSVIGKQSRSEDEYLALITVFNEQGNTLEEIKMDHNGNEEEIHRYRYDEQGRSIEQIVLMPQDDVKEKYLTIRNENGLPVEIIKFYGDDEGEKNIYTYDANNNVLKFQQFDADGELELTEEFEYNAEGKMIRRIVSNILEDKNEVYTFQYNEQGNPEIETEFDGGNKIISATTFKYDTNRLETEIRKVTPDGKLIHLIQTEYNEEQKPVLRNSRGYYVRITRWEYDEKSRLVEEAISDENDFTISRRRFVFGEDNFPSGETFYETDLTRAGRDTHLEFRYQYEFFQELTETK